MGNFSYSVDRFMTVSKVIEGDATAGGTLSRLSERGPRVMKHFYENPIFGFGFSDKMYDYYDGHVANYSLLMQSGIVGFVILYVLIVSLIYRMLVFYLILSPRNGYKLIVLSMAICLMGMIIIHLTSQQMFGFSMRNDKSMLWAFWFLFTFHYLTKAKNHEKILLHSFRNYDLLSALFAGRDASCLDAGSWN